MATVKDLWCRREYLQGHWHVVSAIETSAPPAQPEVVPARPRPARQSRVCLVPGATAAARGRRPLTLTGAAVLLGAAALSGCAPVRAGAAAVVGDQRIRGDQVTASATELTTQAQTVGRQEALTATLTYLVQSQVMTAVAQEQRPPVTVSDGDVAELRKSLEQQSGGSAALDQAFLQRRVPKSGQDAYLRLLLLRQKVGQQVDPAGAADGSDQTAVDKLVAQASKRLHVSVNPRFGRWDAAKGLVEQVASGGLATAASPSPSVPDLGGQ